MRASQAVFSLSHFTWDEMITAALFLLIIYMVINSP
jgi:hypothetical protein